MTRGIEVKGAEDEIPEHEVLAEVLVSFAQIGAVMPAVEFRCVEDVIHPAELHADVAVREEADVGGDGTEVLHDIVRRAGEPEQGAAENHALHGVDDVKAAGVEEPQLFDAVMHGMEMPQRHPSVRDAMCPVETKFRDDEREHDLRPHGPVIRPDSGAGFSADGADEAVVAEHHDDELHEGLGEDGVREIGDHLAVILQPLTLMRAETLQDEEHGGETEVGEVEGELPVPGADADVGGDERGDEQQRPEQVIDNSGELGIGGWHVWFRIWAAREPAAALPARAPRGAR